MTPAQRRANRENAQHSTGPRTADGKARVETGLFTDWQLKHAAKQARARANTFVRNTLDALLNADRQITDRARHAAAEQDAERFEANREAPTPCLGRAFVERETTFANLARYESALESRLYRGLHELRRLQDTRAGRPVVLPLALDVTVTGNVGPELRNEPTAAAVLDAHV